MFTVTCKICGNEFSAKQPSASVCEECKCRPCQVCGKKFERIWPYDQKYCSKECRKIGINDPNHIAEITARRKATVLEKYGVENISQTADVKEMIRHSKIDPEGYKDEKEARIAEEKARVEPVLRRCVICGKEFQPYGNQTTCSGPHYKVCKVCGKQFEFHHLADKRETCSRECWTQLRKISISNKELTCLYCGKKFRSTSSTAKYCPGPHYKKCVICGKDFEIDLSSGLKIEDTPKTCSPECKFELQKQTNLKIYGYEFPTQSEELRERARQVSISNEEQRRRTNLEKYGFENVAQVPEIKERISRTVASKENQEKMKSTMRERYGVDYIMQDPEFARRRGQFKNYVSDGTRVDSKWEAMFYEFLLRNKIEFEYNTQSIEFEYEGRTHVTHIDFKVGDLLFEVKGSHLLYGLYDHYAGMIPIEKKLEIYKKNHVIVITDPGAKELFGKPDSKTSCGLKYPEKCKYPLIGVDIRLFNFPEFPYDENKPRCFYDVRVNENLSIFEAFNNESIRWKMILNRIKYMGGYIDNKQILTALNVTRTYKQPSWFSKSLAKRLIKTYCTSSTIVDPFAGWGTRHDATLELGKKYVGCDLNPELVNWHQSKGRNITCNNAFDFKYDGNCSVLICPPYYNPDTQKCVEDYNFEEFDDRSKKTTECDWLRVVMNNVPNASEYVMVCKFVDDEFSDNVVEVIENKSHIGTSNEYVIVVKNRRE